MKIKKLGRSGLKVTEICLGTMTFGQQADRETSYAIMDLALEAGVNFFDTADMYPVGEEPPQGLTEQIVGRWLGDRKTRSQIVLATKARAPMGKGPNDQGLSRKYLMSAIEASLRRLGTDYVDLYQVHWPDLETPIEETLSALTDMVRQGMVRYIGCSNFAAWQLAEALWASDKHGFSRFDSVQPRYNLLFRKIEDELLPLCRSQGIGVLAYNPLAGGMLTGKYQKTRNIEPGTRFDLRELYKKRYWNEAVFDALEGAVQFLEEREKSLTHASIAWLLSKPAVTSVILGASRPEQLKENLGAVSVQLDREEMEALEQVWYHLPKERP